MSIYVLDTDTLSLFQRGNKAVVDRVLATPPHDICITIITVEEFLSGWYSLLRKRKPAELPPVYARLHEAIQLFASSNILQFSPEAAARFERLRQTTTGRRLGTMDLRIAAIALEQGGVVVTRNVQDFRAIPGLQVDDWSQP